MRKFVLSLAVLGALGLAGQSCVYATPNATGVKLSAGYVGYHLHYKEDITPSDKDTAWMNGAKIKLNYVSEDEGVLGHQYGWISFMYAGSGSKKGDYDGASQDGFGHYSPLSTDATESIERLESGFGFAQIGNKIVTKESIVIGEQVWDRDSEDGVDKAGNLVKGYEEDYGNMYAGLKLEGNYYFTDNFSVGLAVAGAVSPKIKAINQMYSHDNKETYKMGTAYRWKAQLPINYTMERITFNLTPFYSGWKFHKSDTVKNDLGGGDYILSYEPSSKTEETGIYANIAYRF